MFAIDDLTPGSDTSRVYQNAGNSFVVRFLDTTARLVLDVGCGAGDNARLIRAARPDTELVGITWSEQEAASARDLLSEVYIADLDASDMRFLDGYSFDAIICSHVLEHLRDPVRVLTKLIEFLRPEGQVIVAVPNVLELRNRLDFLCGRFEYQETGVMDATHLRFFTWHTAERYIVQPVPGLRLIQKAAKGALPLWLLRRHVLPERWSRTLDDWAVRAFPNLFANEIALECRHSSMMRRGK